MSEPRRTPPSHEKPTLNGVSSWPPALLPVAEDQFFTIDDRYELRRRIGTGGVGSVWEGVDRDLGLAVAVKLSRRQSTEHRAAGLVHEARVLAGLNHPNIVRLLADGVDETHGPYLVMELLLGESLEDQVAAGRRHSLPDVLDWLGPVADALDHLRARALVHRDVKPANIVRCGEGTVKLVDFGLVAHADGRDQLIRGRVAGTPHYLAPEVAQGGIATPASDVYSLAVVAFEMLTGRLPHDGTTAVELMRAKQSRPAPSLGTSSGIRFSAKLESAMEEALSTDPAVRASAGELIERLQSCRR